MAKEIIITSVTAQKKRKKNRFAIMYAENKF